MTNEAEAGRLMELADLASGFSTLAPTAATRRAYQKRARELRREAFAITRPSAAIETMSDDELLAELRC